MSRHRLRKYSSEGIVTVTDVEKSTLPDSSTSYGHLYYLKQLLINEYRRGFMTKCRFKINEYHPHTKCREFDWNMLLPIIFDNLYFQLDSINDLIWLMRTNKMTYQLMKKMMARYPPLELFKFKHHFITARKFILDGKMYIWNSSTIATPKFVENIPKRMSNSWLKTTTPYITPNMVRNYQNANSIEKNKIRKMYFICGTKLIDVPCRRIKSRQRKWKTFRKIHHHPSILRWDYQSNHYIYESPHVPNMRDNHLKQQQRKHLKYNSKTSKKPSTFNGNVYHATGFKRNL